MFEYEIVDDFGIAGTLYANDRHTSSLQLNIIRFNGKPPKFDLRRWYGDTMQKGITLTSNELEWLRDLILSVYGDGKIEIE